MTVPTRIDDTSKNEILNIKINLDEVRKENTQEQNPR